MDRKIIYKQLSSSDHILKIRALQSICGDSFFYTNDIAIINKLEQLISVERHPKVLRWLSLAISKIGNDPKFVICLKSKLNDITDSDVREWIIASIENISLRIGLTEYPIELDSKEDFEIGIIKSWAHKGIQPELLNRLVSSLSHSNSCVRKWAALSIGTKSNLSVKVKDALKESFYDDDYLVREWAMFALKNFASESDYGDYHNVLLKENNVRAREWVIKSLPYTMHHDVPYLLAEEIKHPFFNSDRLYAEAVILAMDKYMDLAFIHKNVISIANTSDDELIILASIKNLLKPTSYCSGSELNDILCRGYSLSKSESVKSEIFMYIIDRLSQSEKNEVLKIIKNECSSSVVRLLFKDINHGNMISTNLLNEAIEEYSSVSQGHDDNIASDALGMPNITTISIQQANIVTGDLYRIEQAAAVGQGAHAEKFSFNKESEDIGNCE